MNAIVGFTALAASHLDNQGQVLDYLNKITVSSQHLLSLINAVLDMSRIKSGKMTLEETDVHLPDLIREPAHDHPGQCRRQAAATVHRHT